MLKPGEISDGNIVVYDGDERVQVHLTDQKILVLGQEYVFDRWHPTIAGAIYLREFAKYSSVPCFPARAFHKKEK